MLCQSCALPLVNPEDFGTNADNSQNQTYCHYCFMNGAFTWPQATLEEFTDKIIHLLNEEKENLVFVLWGSYAQKKASFVDRNKHFVIESPHPSPLSAYRGFFGTRPFSRVNSYLKTKGIQEVDWSLS